MHSENMWESQLSDDKILGSYHSERWAFSVAPLPDESLSSWILRIARANMVSLSLLLRQELKFNLLYKHPERNETRNIARFFSMHTDFTEDEILALVPTVPNLLENRELDANSCTNKIQDKVLFRVNTPSPYTSTHGPRYCPRCLAEDNVQYFRRNWQIGFISACLKHNCLLEDQCPRCKEPLMPWMLKWDEPITSCFNCGFDLSKVEPFFLDRNDDGCNILESIISSNQVSLFNKLFPVMWFMAKNAGINDPVFEGHVITKASRFQEIWNKRLNGNARTAVLAEPGLMFLVLVKSYPLLQNIKKFELFLRNYHSNPTLFLNNKKFICEICDNSFISLDSLTIHSFRHGRQFEQGWKH